MNQRPMKRVADSVAEQVHVLAMESINGAQRLLGSRLMERGYTGTYAVQAIDETLGACTTAQGLARVGLDVPGITAFIATHTEAADGE